MNNMRTVISIIIPSYNSSLTIIPTLRSLEEQSLNNFEVVVVNNGSSDDTNTKIQSFNSGSDLVIKLIEMPKLTRGKARNVGVNNSVGDLLIFYDSDVRINPESVKYHYEFHENIKGGILDGPVLYDLSRINGDFQMYRALREIEWYKRSFKPIRKDRAGLTGANKSMMKKTFEIVGGFSENLYDSEDFYFSFLAMHKYGMDIYQDYRTWVYHDDYKNLESYVKRYKQGNKSAKMLYLNNPDIIEKYPDRWNFDCESNMKYSLFTFFSNKWCLKLDEKSWFLLFPKRIRYKFYEWIFLAHTRIFID